MELKVLILLTIGTLKMSTEKLDTLESCFKIINAIQIYNGIVASHSHPDFDRTDFDCIDFQGEVLIPYTKVPSKSKILPDDEDDYVDLMHEYINSFFDYEEFDLIIKSKELGGTLPTQDMCNDCGTSTPSEFYSLLIQYTEENDIDAIDLPFVIGCLIAAIGLNDEHDRCDEVGTMGDWFVSRFRFDLQNCF